MFVMPVMDTYLYPLIEQSMVYTIRVYHFGFLIVVYKMVPNY